ncbi:MAG: xanthine dehydrogenase family protein molybdopterin-binding subunit, partial [Dongiaceae bacterium]
MSEKGIGSSVRRSEDQRFLTGKGHYVDDMNRPGQAHAAFVRSPHAHARVKMVDTSAARKAPGVIAIFTGNDVVADKLGGLICGWTVKDKNGDPHKAPAHPILANDKVRYVGDHVAVVIAETQAQARDAAEKVDVDYEVLPANIDTAKAMKGAVVHVDAPGNLCYDWELGDRAAVDGIIKNAHHVTRIDLVNN